MRDEWLTLPQAAKQLGVSPRTVRRWIHDGKLAAELRPGPYGNQYLVPTTQLGGQRMVRAAEAASSDEDMSLSAFRDEIRTMLLRQEQSQRTVLEELVREVTDLRAEVEGLRAQIVPERKVPEG